MPNWNRDQLLQALNLYHQTPFGKQHSSHPPILKLAAKIGRSPGAVAMKLSNFTSLDPVESARGISGLSGASRADRAIWEEFYDRLEELAEVSESLMEFDDGDIYHEKEAPSGDSEIASLVKVRRHQRFFRRAVMGSYQRRCCISGNPVPELLRASHIVPWSEAPEHRVDPSNGLCLAATYDAAFDRGLISVTEDYRILISDRLRSLEGDGEIRRVFLEREGGAIILPAKNLPRSDFLAWHREMRFVG